MRRKYKNGTRIKINAQNGLISNDFHGRTGTVVGYQHNDKLSAYIVELDRGYHHPAFVGYTTKLITLSEPYLDKAS
jgi:ribosomal protein L21E